MKGTSKQTEQTVMMLGPHFWQAAAQASAGKLRADRTLVASDGGTHCRNASITTAGMDRTGRVRLHSTCHVGWRLG